MLKQQNTFPQSEEDVILLLPPKIKMNNYKIKQFKSFKFLSLLLVENLTGKLHNEYIENESATILVYYLKLKYF